MIEVSNIGKYEIRVCGHAGAAPYGQDIVCSGVSALVLALVEMLERCKDELTEYDVTVENGNAHINVVPRTEFERELAGAFFAIRCGFENIALLYPQFVNIIQKNA